MKIASEQRTVETDPRVVDREVKAREIDEMYRRYVKGRLPGVSSTCLKVLTCLYTSLPDGGFVIDFYPQDSNIIIVSPCSGHGFKHSAAIGEAVAEMIVSDFDSDYERFRGLGIEFTEGPWEHSYGKVAVFKDLYGNRIDLIQPVV